MIHVLQGRRSTRSKGGHPRTPREVIREAIHALRGRRSTHSKGGHPSALREVIHALRERLSTRSVRGDPRAARESDGRGGRRRGRGTGGQNGSQADANALRHPRPSADDTTANQTTTSHRWCSRAGRESYDGKANDDEGSPRLQPRHGDTVALATQASNFPSPSQSHG